MKRNLFLKKIECWECNQFFHKLILTKYHGVLCKSCYNALYEETKSLFQKPS